MNRSTYRGALFGALMVVASLAGCSGGGRHTSVLPQTASGPPTTGGAGIARKPLTINGASYQQVCAPPGGGRAACAAVIPAAGSAPMHVVRGASGVRRTSSLPADVYPYNGLWPTDLVSAYGLPFDPTVGAGMTVAIVDAFDSPTVEADLAVFRGFFGLPACTTQNGCFRKLNARGQQRNYPPVNIPSGWALEAVLDVEAVSATCPNCKIVLVEANSDFFSDLATATNTAATTGAQAISNSYYGPEVDPNPSPGDPPMTAFASAYRHPGIIVTAATGDFGFDEGFATPSGAPFPAGLPEVVAVGGTALTFAEFSVNPRGWDEVAWSGSGGGCSTMFARPAWQSGACGHRLSADVSAAANGLAVYYTAEGGAWGVVGGTSASTPIIAGLFALGGNASSMNAAASVYNHPTALFDITTGPATGTCTPAYFCTARAGYDGPTGMGTPNGTRAFGGTAKQWRSLARGAAVEVAANDTALWIVNDDGAVRRFAFGNWVPVSVPGRPARLALSPGGTPYVVTREGKLFSYAPSSGWSLLGCCAADVAVGWNEDIWVVQPGGAIAENSGSGWVRRPGSAQRIAASNDGGVWIVDRRGNASQWNGSAFTSTGCCFSDIGAADGNLAYAIGEEGQSVWRFDGSWSRVRATGSAIAVTPARAVPYVVQDDDAIVFYD